MRPEHRTQLRRAKERAARDAKWLCGDRRITRGSGNIFLDVGFNAAEAERAMRALQGFHAKGGRSYDDFKAELGDLFKAPAPWEVES